MGYSPEVVTGIWVGNNDNSRMTYQASGWMSARPIWIDYTNKIVGRFKATSFPRPGGIVTAATCLDSSLLASDNCDAISDLFIQDKMPEKDNTHETYKVCKDQQNRLARDIDIELGYAVDKVFGYIKAPKEEWQPYWDKIFNQSAPPTEYCTKNRNPSGDKNPWVVISNPENGIQVDQGESLALDITAYSSSTEIEKIEIYIDDIYITQATNNPFVANITVPFSISDGAHTLTAKAFDAAGRSGSASVSIIVGDVISITYPENGSTITLGSSVTITALHQGATSVNSASVRINTTTYSMTASGDNSFTYSWVPISERTYTVRVVLNLSDGSSISSSQIVVYVSLIADFDYVYGECLSCKKDSSFLLFP
ncbi:MAG: Ig-like domain-containing protein, partial [Candidatus Dojkabacteria bacterium]|nr:Ig-like domain-containing protein [Candidatus Dojkabacteria bacterium]